MMTSAQGFRNVSHHYRQQSLSGLHSPGRSNYTITCYPRVKTIYCKIRRASECWETPRFQSEQYICAATEEQVSGLGGHGGSHAVWNTRRLAAQRSWKPETACEAPLSSWPGRDGNVGPSLLPYVTASIIGRNYKPLLAKFSFLNRQLLSECTIVFGEYFKMYVTSNKSICIFLNGELTQWTDAKKTLFSYSHLFRRVCQFSWQ